MILLLLLFPFLIIAPAYSDENLPRVKTPLGTVIGHYKTSYKGRRYEVYEGIPYAKPPKGSLRFEEPVPIGPWGILNANNSKSVCTQYFDIPPDENGLPVTEGRVTGSDDCLYLSINVPVWKDVKRKLPVIFLIHGGSYQYGNGLIHGARNKYLLDRDIVFVSINYRLGILGFLSTEDDVLPGNLGLKDQSLALRWTSENIAYFGGDPNRIIIVGYSAGSSSIQYHYLSPLSRGLFHGSIGLSGTVFNPWGFTLGAKEKAQKLAAIFNCPTQDSRELVDCLKEIPAQTLMAATKEFQYWQFMPEAPFAPVIEKAGSRPFINKSPQEIADAKEMYDVPAVFGSVSEEGCDPGAAYAAHDNVLKDLNDNWMSIAPHLLQYNYTIPRKFHNILAIATRKFYFENQKINKSTASALIRMLSDKHYLIGIEQGVRLQAKATKSPVYFYYYSFKGLQSRSEDISHTKNNYGVCHSDDTLLVLENNIIDPTKTENELKMSGFLLDMWESVAYNGVPELGIEWRPVDSSNKKISYLHIYGPGNYNMSGDANFGHKYFWTQFPSLRVK